MTDFKTYFNKNFRRDINKFFETIPDQSRFHKDSEFKPYIPHPFEIKEKTLLLDLFKSSQAEFEPKIYSIQYERLTSERKHLDFLDKEAKELFGVALFFIVLIDMVCYTNYNHYYWRFQSRTWYPKLIGNCELSCRFYLDPKNIFYAMNEGSDVTEPYFSFSNKLSEASEYMEQVTIKFFDQYFNKIGTEFWGYCKPHL